MRDNFGRNFVSLYVCKFWNVIIVVSILIFSGAVVFCWNAVIKLKRSRYYLSSFLWEKFCRVFPFGVVESQLT